MGSRLMRIRAAITPPANSWISSAATAVSRSLVHPTQPSRRTSKPAGSPRRLFDLQINGCDGLSFNSPHLTTEARPPRRRRLPPARHRRPLPHARHQSRRSPAARLRHPAPRLRDGRRGRPRHAGPAPGRPVHQPRGRPARRPSAPPRPTAGLGRVPPLPGRRRRPHPPGDAGSRTRRRLALHRKADRLRRRRGAGPYRRDGCAHPRRRRAPAPGCPRTSATARTPCCRGTTTTSGNSWPPTNCGPASSATAITCRRPWSRCILRVKTPARTILTCDASSLAGLPPGRYREWDQEFEVLPSGKVVVPGTTLPGRLWRLHRYVRRLGGAARRRRACRRRGHGRRPAAPSCWDCRTS